MAKKARGKAHHRRLSPLKFAEIFCDEGKRLLIDEPVNGWQRWSKTLELALLG